MPVAIAAVGHAFLRAAWVCDDTEKMRQATETRALAADWFQRCKPFAADEQSLLTGAVLVDVLRRSGRLTEASVECAELLVLPGLDGVVRRMLWLQERLIAQGDRFSPASAGRIAVPGMGFAVPRKTSCD